MKLKLPTKSEALVWLAHHMIEELNVRVSDDGGGFNRYQIRDASHVLVAAIGVRTVKVNLFIKVWNFLTKACNPTCSFVYDEDRTARTDLAIITSEIHQMFGRYYGRVVTDDGKTVQIKDLIGFAEEHHAKW